jgi:hypothetical protein
MFDGSKATKRKLSQVIKGECRFLQQSERKCSNYIFKIKIKTVDP